MSDTRSVRTVCVACAELIESADAADAWRATHNRPDAYVCPMSEHGHAPALLRSVAGIRAHELLSVLLEVDNESNVATLFDALLACGYVYLCDCGTTVIAGDACDGCGVGN